MDFLNRVGRALGEECRARGVHCLLGPTTNIQRHPCGGRGFESYGEGESAPSVELIVDPLFSGTLASAWIEGVQSSRVMTCKRQ